MIETSEELRHDRKPRDRLSLLKLLRQRRIEMENVPSEQTEQAQCSRHRHNRLLTETEGQINTQFTVPLPTSGENFKYAKYAFAAES